METPECVSIALEVPRELEAEFKFIQGQNITVKRMIGGEEIRRSYSICSSPLDQELRVAVKKAEYGKFSTLAMELQKGEILDVLPPTGAFYTLLDPANKKNYTAFAAGSGITPLLSIIKTTLATEPASRFTLIYGNRSRHSIIFREELEGLKNRYMDRFSLFHVLSREETDAPVNAGRIDAAKCRELNGKLLDIAGSDEFFLCGPQEMIFTVRDFLEKEGVPADNIHFELFTTPAAPGPLSREIPGQRSGGVPASQEQTSEVMVKADGRNFSFTLAYSGESVLDAALGQGADLPYSCKGGVCSTCRARLLQGAVEMDANYALEKDELEAGYILTCQSHPRTPTVMISYDE